MFSRFFAILKRISSAVLTDPLRRFQLSIVILALLILFGTFGYMALEDWPPTDALYMTVITIATVGFGEVRELSQDGRIFTIMLILLGVGAATTAISNAVSFVLGPLMWSTIQRHRLERRIQTMDTHYIICGYGRMGRQIANDLAARGEKFVIVDSNETVSEHLLEAKIPHIVGDATADEVLVNAGVKRAKGLVAALNSDAGNIMTVLTAREMNEKLFIVARVARSESESKLYRAGANHVINPYQIGGHRIALSLLRPAVHEFLNYIFHFGEGSDSDVGQIVVDEGSKMAGQTIAGCDLRSVHGLNVLAIQRPNGELTITPNPSTTLQVHDVLIVIGPPAAIYKLEERQ